jgi:hypothetical protein
MLGLGHVRKCRGLPRIGRRKPLRGRSFSGPTPTALVEISVAGRRAPGRRCTGQGVLLEPTLQRRAVDTNEVPTITGNHWEARHVRPLVKDLFAHLAQVGGLGARKQQW